jgi:hypothetical protein
MKKLIVILAALFLSTGAIAQPWNWDLSPTRYGLVVGNGNAPVTWTAAGTTGQVLTAVTSGVPIWSTLAIPTTSVINQILYSSATNTVSGLATVNSAVLVTNGTGVPGFQTVVSPANGGDSLVNPPINNIALYNGAKAYDSVGAGTANYILKSGGQAAKPSWIQSVPVANGGTGGTTIPTAQSGLGFGEVILAADTLITVQTLTGTPLQFTVGTNQTWTFDAYLTDSSGTTAGSEYGVLLPATCTMLVRTNGTVGGITAFSTDRITASNTAGIAYATTTVTPHFLEFHGTVTSGGTGGSVVIQFLKVTGDKSVIKAGSYIIFHRVS